MKRLILPLLLVAVVFLGAAGCGSYVPVASGDNFAYLYGKGAAAIRLQARIYQPDDARAVIYFKLRTADLLYKGTGGGGPYHARVVMSYEAYPAPDSKELLDSASTFVKDQSMVADEDKELIGSMPLKTVGNTPFILRITAHDLNRDAQSTVMLRVDRGASGSAQEFLPLGANGLPIFDDHVRPGTTLKVEAERHAGALLHVGHYPPVQKLPAPVFANVPPPALDNPPDSTFTVRVQPDGTFNFTTGADGFYHFRADTASVVGFTLFVPTESYPTVSTAQDMVSPLRYITSLKEWDALSTSPTPRKDVERFWTDAAGSRDRARDAIAGYYGRVESANRHFSSYTEGWKTDRGLVHIIFGTPSTIRKDARGETWVYGDETNLMSLVFNFVRRDEPFSGNDLVLQRDPQLKSAWYRNVESWRNGRILQN
ncbi:MAG: GWxTD domain-containing protein [Flavobacteriales bacterium]|jgi:GWxTD domain-containing protein|nr:GWxTD domain-containing protein [Flavobacteriales bacterium]MCB0757370.1 GWxTD domain-containing protein [Flavobacteriales bacterium]